MAGFRLPALASPRTAALWAVALLAALAGARIVAGDLAALHERARDAGSEVDVVVAAGDLALGRTIQADDLRTARHFEGRLPPGALRDRADAIGRVVTTPVLEGGALTDRHLAARDRTGLDGVVPPGMRAVRIVPEDGARPAPGSVVDVLVTFDATVVDPAVEPTTTVIEGALVVAVDDLPELGTPDPRSGVTLLTDPEGAHRLAFAVAHGLVSLAIAPPEQACCP